MTSSLIGDGSLIMHGSSIVEHRCWVGSSRPKVARRLSPCYWTNDKRERNAVGYDDTKILYDESQDQVPDPHLGPMQHRVDTNIFQAIDDDVMPSPYDMEYWFTEPEGGWKGVVELERLKAIDHYEPSVGRNNREGMVPIDNFSEGQVIQGEVTKLMLHAGALVDFGATFDGLIPLTMEQWDDEGFNELIDIGMQVKCRIYKIRNLEWFRFPVQLELLEPQLEKAMPPPESHEPSLDLRGKPRDLDLYIKMSGREYKPKAYWLPDDEHDLGLTNRLDAIADQVFNPEKTLAECEEALPSRYIDNRIQRVARSLMSGW